MNKAKVKSMSISLLASSLAFSIFQVAICPDVSAIAFPVSVLYTAIMFFSFRSLFVKDKAASLPAFRYLIQYAPIVFMAAFIVRRVGAWGVPFMLDALSVLLWLFVLVMNCVIMHYLKTKNVEKIDAEWKAAADKINAKIAANGALKTGLWLMEWVDALVQSVFAVLLLNIFLVQLYVIPSESMVPEFLIGDRVIVFKLFNGPKFPMSQIGLPYMHDYKRGEIVVFRNPHYESTKMSEMRTVLSNFVYMITLTKVNLNTDSDGNPKADPLVKRIAGIAGEQLVMQDGVLYHRTKESAEFTPVAEDAEWAAWNLNDVPSRLHSGIQVFPLPQNIYDMMIGVESVRREKMSAAEVLPECLSLSSRFSALYDSIYSGEKIAGGDDVPEIFQRNELYALSLLSKTDSAARKLLSSAGGDEWFSAFMTDWAKTDSGQGALNGVEVGGNPYDEANFRLNLMIKLCVGKSIVRAAELMEAKVSYSDWKSDSYFKSYAEEAEALGVYLRILDSRNMPVFPANNADGTANYIPENCYFMMGDNRFNSLDMRHSYEYTLRALTPFDEYSVLYESNMEPQYVSRSKMLGSAGYRFWPLSRRGVPGHTGKIE